MRKVNIGTDKFTTVICIDSPGEGGACHEYNVIPVNGLELTPFSTIKFQKGPIREAGINGCHQEDLIKVVIDRLQHFQKGEYACRENAIALTKLEEAMHWLNHRTQNRINRGVEGTSKK